MVVIEKSGLLKYKDEDGNVYTLHPITKLDEIEGAELGQVIIVAAVGDNDTPTVLEATDMPAVKVEGETLVFTTTTNYVDDILKVIEDGTY